MAWFVIKGEKIWSDDFYPYGEHKIYGIRLGGRWCLDYTFKLLFNISSDDWNTRFENIKTDQDFYDICEEIGVYYMKNNIIYRKGEKYDKFGNKL